MSRFLFRSFALSLMGLLLVGGCPPPAGSDNTGGPDDGQVDDGGSDDGGSDDGGSDDGGSDDGGSDDGGSDDGGSDDGGSDDGGSGDEPDNFDAEFSGNAQKLTPYRDKLNSDEAYHLMRRLALGATPQQVDAAVKNGLNATVDDLMTWDIVPPTVNALASSYESDVTRRWMIYLLESPNPLHERMTMFWHDRFATSYRVAADYQERNLPNQHYNMLAKHALGNYRKFLQDLTLDPLMLLWLNGADSPKSNPNENYAREFWELFTLGRDVLYSEEDIQEAARAFTGMSLLYSWPNDPRPIFDLYNHDNTDKLIFPQRDGSAANHDYLSVIELTLAQPEAPRYVARNLFAFFVHDHPSDEVVQELADLFVARDFDIRPVVRKILTSQALFSAEARYNQIASPVEHYVGVARTLDMHLHSEESQGWPFQVLVDELANAGQQLLDPPGVQGWSEGPGWLEDQWLMARAEAFSRMGEFGPNRTDDLPYHLLPTVSRWNEREIRREIVLRLASVFHLDLTEDEIDIYVEVLDQNGHEAFHLLPPEQQPRHVFEVIRLMAMDERVMTR